MTPFHALYSSGSSQGETLKTWREIYSESGLDYEGSLYFTTWASRATKAIDALTDFQFELLAARGPQGTPIARQQLQVEDSFQELVDSVIAFRSAVWAESNSRFEKSWEDLWDAVFALEDATNEIGALIFPQANTYCESRFD